MFPDDGMRLRKHLEQEFESGNRQIYWDDVAMFCHFEDYTLGIKAMNKEAIVEIDSVEELCAIDKSYLSALNERKDSESL